MFNKTNYPYPSFKKSNRMTQGYLFMSLDVLRRYGKEVETKINKTGQT